MSAASHTSLAAALVRRIGAVALLGAAIAVCPAAAHADRTAADYFAQRGDKAAKEKKWAEAQENYRKALEEDPHHVPARAGLGDAQFAAGDRGAAMESWRSAPADAEASQLVPLAWADALSRAKKRLADAEGASAALAQLVDKHVDDLVALAERWAEKDPEVTARALRTAVRLRPQHAKAAAMFEKIGSPTGDWAPLFDGRTLEGWLGADTGMWRVEEGQLIGDVHKGTYRLIRNQVWKGDFDIRVEAKFLEQYEGQPGFEIGGAMKWGVQGTVLGVVGEELNLQEHDGQERTAMRFAYMCALADLANPFDTAAWTTYELQFRGKEIRVVINGKEMVTRERAAERDEGQVTLTVQNQRIAFRKVEVMQR